MDDFNAILARVPPAKRAALQSWWQHLPVEHRARGLADLTARYPTLPTAGAQIAVPSSEVARPGLPMMGVAPIMEAAQPGPRIAVEDVPQPGAVRSFGNAVLNTLPFADEAAGALTSGSVSGPAYETARRLAEYQLGRGTLDHPVATTAGTGAGLLGLTIATGGASTPEVLGAEGAGRQFARSVGTNAAIGAVYGAGASDPGASNRLLGAAGGGVAGAGLALPFAAAGELAGARAGTARGRVARDVALAGETPLSASRRILDRAHPDSPLTAADVLGPVARSRVRAGSVVPGEAQDIYAQTYGPRRDLRPGRLMGAIEDASGTAGMNPYSTMEQMQAAKSAEAERLYTAAYAEKPSKDARAIANTPRLKQMLSTLRANARANGETVPVGGATVRELHSLRKILDKQSQALDNPAAASADREAAFGLAGLRDRLDAALKTSPRFAEADRVFRESSGVQESFEFGTGATRQPASLVEHTVDGYSPAQKEGFRLGLPASIARDVEGGSARGVLGRVGLGSTSKLGKARILDAGFSPEVRARVGQVVRDEELMAPTEQAAMAGREGSMTEPNKQSAMEAGVSGLSFGVPGLIRREILQSLRSAPSSAELARTARVLTTSGTDLNALLGEAERATVNRGSARRGFQLGARIASAALPTGVRLNTDAKRAALTRLVNSGLSEEEAIQLLDTP